jgi:hypothetical protein
VEASERHREIMRAAIARDGDAQRALRDGEAQAAQSAFTDAAALYRESWEAAPPGGYGRIVGMLKSAVLAGGGAEQATYALAELGDEGRDSPTASYARAIAALILGDDAAADENAGAMRSGSDAFGRAADAVAALAEHDQPAYGAAVGAIVRDFEAREEHLTGVPIADTALMLERLAEGRGMAARVNSALLPSG